MTARAALATALIPDAQRRLTVSPGTVTGSPASSNAIRATFRLSSPAWFALPRMTSPIRAASSVGWRRSNSVITCAARSSARTSLSPPPMFPTAVRTPSTIYASVIQTLRRVPYEFCKPCRETARRSPRPLGAPSREKSRAGWSRSLPWHWRSARRPAKWPWDT